MGPFFMKKKIQIVTQRQKQHEVIIDEPESPVTIEYSINAPACNYTPEVIKAIEGLDLTLDDVVMVRYVQENIEKYERTQGADVKNTIKKYGV